MPNALSFQDFFGLANVPAPFKGIGRFEQEASFLDA